MRIPNSPSRGDTITADHMRAISDAIRDLYAKMSALSNDRYRPILGAGGGESSTCNFGELYTYSAASDSDSGSGDETKTGIRGGGIEAGNVWEMPPYEVDLTVEGAWIIWIRTPVVVNLTPLGDASMSGIASSTTPSWEYLAYDSDSDIPITYGDKLVPAIFPAGDGAGVSITPIGTLTVAGGSATLVRSGCGDIIITHCPGNLSHRRGYVDAASTSE